MLNNTDAIKMENRTDRSIENRMNFKMKCEPASKKKKKFSNLMVYLFGISKIENFLEVGL